MKNKRTSMSNTDQESFRFNPDGSMTVNLAPDVADSLLWACKMAGGINPASMLNDYIARPFLNDARDIKSGVLRSIIEDFTTYETVEEAKAAARHVEDMERRVGLDQGPLNVRVKE